MKHLYLIVGILILSFFSSTASAQFTGGTFTAITTGTWSSPATWDANGIPTPSCLNCLIIINGGVTLTLDQNVSLFSSEVLVGNDASTPAMFVLSEEMDIDVSTVVRLANPNTQIDATNSSNATASGPFGFVGIFFDLGFGAVNIAISEFGYGDPSSPGGLTSAYFFNCDFGLITEFCAPGVVYGPAITSFNSTDLLYEFGVSTILPVTLTDFTAHANQDNASIALSWNTQQEQNSSHFNIQKSTNGTTWSTIGRVDAKGNSTNISHYNFTDFQPAPVNYYRLQMVDLDNKSELSRVLVVSLNKKDNAVIVFNNPFKDAVRLQVNASASQELRLTMTDIQGKVQVEKIMQAQPGTNFIEIPASQNFARGVYILSISGTTITKTIKLVKQ